MMPGALENARVALEEEVPLINVSLGKADWIAQGVRNYGGKNSSSSQPSPLLCGQLVYNNMLTHFFCYFSKRNLALYSNDGKTRSIGNRQWRERHYGYGP